ncbi:hypothetical protein BH20CHL1_BH20CHL1_08660 [soil metagenome]
MVERQWTTAQSRAISHQQGPLRIIAGAGSGKTATMTAHIAQLIQSEIAQPDQIVALTFTNAAAGELTERIQGSLNNPQVEVWSGTYHSFGGQIVADGSRKLGLPAQPHLLSTVESWLLVRQILRNEVEIEQRDLRNFPGAVNELRDLVSRCKDELVTPDGVRAYIATIPEDDDEHATEMRDLLKVYECYQEHCRSRGALDFGDQIALAIEALDSDPELLADYRERYRVFIVDEYQDTNYAQAELVKRLAAPDCQLRVVGDPQQSIYRFRGAAVDNIKRFSDEIEDVSDVGLSTNFRSQQRILDIANRIVSGADMAADLRAHNDRTGQLPVIGRADDWADECEWIAQTFAEHHNTGATNLAVLVHKRKLLPALARAFERAGLPYQVLGGQALFEFPAVKDAVAMLRLLQNPADTTSAVRVLTSPRCGLNDRTVFGLRRHLRSANYLTALNEISENPPADLKPEFVQAARAFCADLGSLLGTANSQGVDVLTRMVVQRQRSNGTRQESQALEQLMLIARQFTENGIDTSLTAYIDYLDALSQMNSDEASIDIQQPTDAVALMTIHAAKGLEFDAVALAGMNAYDAGSRANPVSKLIPPPLRHDRDQYPSRDDFVDRDTYLTAIKEVEKRLVTEEERRLFYVAVTRAREHLYLTWSENHPARKIKTKRFPLLDSFADLTQAVELPASQRIGGVPPLRAFFEATNQNLNPEEDCAGFAQTWADYWQGKPEESEAMNALDSGLSSFMSSRLERASQIGLLQRTLTDNSFEPARTGVYSYSQISVYERCPRLYLLHYLVGVPANPANDWQTQLGSAFHDALHALSLAQEAGMEIDLEGLVRRQYGDAQAEFESDATQRAISGFLRHDDAVSRPLMTEREFYLRLGSGRDVPVIRGFIDRVQRRPDGAIEIVDYKTNRVNKSRDEVLQDLQLPIYVLACREALDIEPDYATMAFVRHDNWVRIDVNDMDMSTARQRIDTALTGIRNGQFGCICHGAHCAR